MIAVDLFAGAGGFTTGAEAAGLTVAFAANHWDLAVKVHALNHPHVQHAQQDLRQFDFSTLPAFDVLLASPSCQGHSRAGQPARASSAKVTATHDAYRSTAWAVVDCLEVCRPRYAVIENVPEFLTWPLFAVWLSALDALGYVVTTQVLTASRWGVPQRRKRAILVAVHEGKALHLRDPEVSEPSLVDVFDPSAKGWKPIAEMKATRSEKGHKTAREKVELANAKLGGALGWGMHVNSESAWGCEMSRPVNTITTKAGQIWWVRDGMYRLWSRTEVVRAMGFPETYAFGDASKTDSFKLLGNAVPPPMARGVLKAVLPEAA